MTALVSSIAHASLRRALAVTAVTAAVAACKTPEPDPEARIRMEFVQRQALANDAGAAFRLTSTEEVFFDDGWNPMETMPATGVHGEVWRWMGRTSLVRLRRHDVPMRLSITGWVPMHILGHTPLLTVRWNGARLATFLAPQGHFTRTFDITPEMQARSLYSDMAIETTSTAQERNDLRELGFALAELRWDPAESRP